MKQGDRGQGLDGWVGLQRGLSDLRAPEPARYLADLFSSSALVWGAIASAARASSPAGFGFATLIAGLALSRVALMAHELSHQRDRVPGLRFFWHLLLGVPLLFPSFIYERVHRQHHRLAVYRTALDPEHAPDASSLLQRTITHQLGALLLPPFLLVRWLLLTPVSFTSPKLRAFVLGRLSSLTMNPGYRAPVRRPRAELWLELTCTAWSFCLVALVIAGALPGRAVLAASLAISIALGVSDLRGEVLHQFKAGARLGTLERQVLDSVNLARGGLLTRLLFPMGIGYHALHHLAPWLPYHRLDEAHARSVAMLGEAELVPATRRAWASRVHFFSCSNNILAIWPAVSRCQRSLP